MDVCTNYTYIRKNVHRLKITPLVSLMLILPDLEMKKIQEFRGMEERNYNLLPFFGGNQTESYQVTLGIQ